VTDDRPALAAVEVGGAPVTWQALGFRVASDGTVALGNGAIRLVDAPTGVRALIIDRADVPASIDGVAVAAGTASDATDHPNGAFELDHVVVTTDSLERTSAAFADQLGLPQRRVREAGEGTRRVRQAFHRFGNGCILEIVESARTTGGVALFGLVVNVADLESLCDELGPELIGPPKPAVQPGRLIATVRSHAGVGFPVALMSP
jgi:hypothetical protein